MRQTIYILALLSAAGVTWAADATVRIAAGADGRAVPPGAVGWGAMWKADLLQPPPPGQFASDADHQAYIQRLGEANKAAIEAADVRNLSWPWGVSFSTWAVNWENSAKPWSQRAADCVNILGRVSPWCETTVVGVGDLLTLARIWNLEAVTLSEPLAIIDGSRPRWGPGFADQVFSPETIEKISDHAAQQIDYLRAHPDWSRLQRVYLAAGCEWRHYKLESPSPAVLSYVALVRRIREKIPDKKVIIIASASDSADIPGIKNLQSRNWNPHLYAGLIDVSGVALDLHRYRGSGGVEPGPNGETLMTDRNIDALLGVGLRQRGFLAVRPEQWDESGPAAPTVLLENAIHGLIADHATRSAAPRPWPVAMAHADLVREALSGDAMTFLGWTWFPETLPREWPHGALLSDGGIASHARAQAFLSRHHRGVRLPSRWSDESALRGNATRTPDGAVVLAGGNFSRTEKTLTVALEGLRSFRLERAESLSSQGIGSLNPASGGEWKIPPLTLFRLRFVSGVPSRPLPHRARRRSR